MPSGAHFLLASSAVEVLLVECLDEQSLAHGVVVGDVLIGYFTFTLHLVCTGIVNGDLGSKVLGFE